MRVVPCVAPVIRVCENTANVEAVERECVSGVWIHCRNVGGDTALYGHMGEVVDEGNEANEAESDVVPDPASGSAATPLPQSSQKRVIQATLDVLID